MTITKIQQERFEILPKGRKSISNFMTLDYTPKLGRRDGQDIAPLTKGFVGCVKTHFFSKTIHNLPLSSSSTAP